MTTFLRRVLLAGTAAAVLFAGAGGAVAAPAAGDVRPAAGPVSPVPAPAGQLRPLAALSADRLATADLVAAAKWGTGSPIDDPAREREVLAAVAAQARQLGADPETTVRIFRDQIEASKLVQRGLHRRWAADPAQAPTSRPDLTRVRAEINRINGELVRAVAASPQARTAPGCVPRLTVSALRVGHERHLDLLHAAGLARSLRSVCGRG
ncbi:gamma subclass chorismate mutase AroQ [Streptomyces sp. S186]|uniref:gamma subclass chorismate mutase AroQ n=1 Tax=Streptomyces sp. S186 TaxID=3434395 RepID=UPI003F6617B1